MRAPGAEGRVSDGLPVRQPPRLCLFPDRIRGLASSAACHARDQTQSNGDPAQREVPREAPAPPPTHGKGVRKETHEPGRPGNVTIRGSVAAAEGAPSRAAAPVPPPSGV
jgi:hypothetical protein